MDKINLNDLKKSLHKLIKEKAFFKEKITLASGKVSDYYIDARLITLNSEGSYLVASIILELLKNDVFQAIGGPTIGADPIVGAIGALRYLEKKPVNTFIVRKKPKEHGKRRQIEGPEIRPGSKVILIDDVATTGGSLVDAVMLLAQDNIEVLKAVVIVDRQEGAKENLAKVNCPLISIFTAKDFLS
ncbi:MAG: orotate phosphoribosyltransferase [Candidatus Omnitrophica bacterium]|nr:orotate phosphoribosyltransferase [Candidatus Omnitrophota bacterium]HOX53946.1 orotate phosphoribosyltransferase [Candidatus Omnitrophota bacterium]